MKNPNLVSSKGNTKELMNFAYVCTSVLHKLCQSELINSLKRLFSRAPAWKCPCQQSFDPTLSDLKD